MKKGPWQTGDYSDTQKLQFLLRFLPRVNNPKASASTFIPAKETESGVIVMGYEVLGKNADDFLEGAYSHGWVQDFDWPAWRQSKDAVALFDNPSTLALASIEDIAKIITTILRMDRSVGGKLAKSFNDGLIARIALRAERLLEFAVMQSDQRPWPCEYYDAMHHYFYAPERLGHESGPKEDSKGRYDRVMERIKRIEEPLNHIMGLFFALVPSRFIYGLFAEYCGTASSGPLRLLGRSVEKEYHLKNSTQPDFTFDGPDSFLTIEAKIDAKSGIEQLIKYAILHYRAELKTLGRNHALLFLSKKSQEQFFKEKLEGWQQIKKRAKEVCVDKEPLKFLQKLDINERHAVAAMIDSLKLGYMNFSNLADALDKQSKLMRSALNEEGEKLYLGLLFELKRRSLCD